MSRNYYKSGAWNVTCDSCSKKVKSTEVKQRWDGFIVCPDCFEPRHSQDFVKPKQDKISVPFARPIPTYVYVPMHYTETINETVYTIEGLSYVAEYYRDIIDSVTSEDSLVVASTMPLTDTVETSENIATFVYTEITLLDSVSTDDTPTLSITTKVSDSTSSTDSLGLVVGLQKTDIITTADELVTTVEYHLVDSSSTVDSLNTASVVILADTATTTDTSTQIVRTLTTINGNVINGDTL